MNTKVYFLIISIFFYFSCKNNTETKEQQTDISSESNVDSVISYMNKLDSTTTKINNYKGFVLNTKILNKVYVLKTKQIDSIDIYLRYKYVNINPSNDVNKKINKQLHENFWQSEGYYGSLSNFVEEFNTYSDSTIIDFIRSHGQSSSIKIVNKLLSYVIEIWDSKYGSGYAYCYRLDSGERVYFENLFENIDDVKIIALKYYERLMLKKGSSIGFYDFTFPEGKYFYFTEKSIGFIYHVGEIDCTAGGIIKLEIPLFEIKKYLKPEIRDMLK